MGGRGAEGEEETGLIKPFVVAKFSLGVLNICLNNLPPEWGKNTN